MINEVTIEGKIVSGVELRSTKKGIPVSDFRIVNKTNRKVKNSVFIDIEVWGNEAKKVHDLASKGSKVVINGEIRRDVWTTKDTGEHRSKLKITAKRVIVSDVGYTREDENTQEAF